MMRLEIKGTSEKLRKALADGTNCVIEIITEDGDVLLGGTYAQRAWLTGDKSQGLSVPTRKSISKTELEIVKEAEGVIYVFEDTLYLISFEPSLSEIKYPLNLLPVFKEGGVKIEDLR